MDKVTSWGRGLQFDKTILVNDSKNIPLRLCHRLEIFYSLNCIFFNCFDCSSTITY